MTKTTHGYVLVYVGKKHHLADIRGYAYLHRVNAELKIGRRLNDGEEVHHKDGNRDNNNPDNLEVKKNRSYHLLEHRSDKNKDRLKHPDQPNYEIECLCGCGERFMKYDDVNRPRDYIQGHNKNEAELQIRILSVVDTPISIADIQLLIGSKCSIKGTLSKMVKDKKIDRVDYGVYAKVGTKKLRENTMSICLCGCGGEFYKYDKHKRIRKYISGHNSKKNKKWEVIQKLNGQNIPQIYFGGVVMQESDVITVTQKPWLKDGVMIFGVMINLGKK